MRSARSITITTSAASDDTVAPFPAIAIPTSASARAGASLIPSPAMTTAPACGRRTVLDDPELVGRTLLGVHLVDAELRGDLPGDIDPVTAHERDVLDARVVQLRRDAVSPWTKVIGHDDHCLKLAVYAHEDLRAPRAVPTVEGRVCERADAVVAAVLEPAGRPDHDPSAVHATRDAPAGPRRHPSAVERQPAGSRGADEASARTCAES